jgi:two-component system response regulator VicR
MDPNISSSSVIVVDDEKEFGKVVREILESMGVHVRVAYTAKAAKLLIENEQPDLLLLDVMMPEVDGLSLLRDLRNHLDSEQLPTIVVSAKVSEEDKRAAFKAGADAFVEKPMSVDDLEAAIRRFLPTATFGE